MILNQPVRTFKSNAENVSKEFTIKTTAKAFKILSGGLYSDKIKAIIRELSCNAIDAHTEAGNKKPFTVHLPNELEPWFTVQDYGIGLSEEDILNLYSTYFESTKTGSNDQIGALGLGSKSPFSYTDSFNVTSIFGGEKKIYTAYIDKNGTPSIVKVHTEESEDHNGIEVKFPVAEEDFNSFVQKAAAVFRIYKTKPNIVGSTSYKRHEQTLTTILKGKGWALNKTDFYTNTAACAIQGNIEYPIDTNQLGKLTNEESAILTNKFYIDFNIGDLDVAASRESLGYDENTVRNIKTATNKIYKSVMRKVNKEIKAAPSLWEANIKATELLSELKLYSSYGHSVTCRWGGKEFEVGRQFSYTFSKESIKDESGFKISKVEDSTLQLTILHKPRRYRSNTIKKIATYEASLNYNITFSITPANTCVFIVNNEGKDGLKKAMRKARQYVRNNTDKIIHFLNEEREEFFDALGNPTYINTSDLKLETYSYNRGSSNVENYFNLSIDGYKGNSFSYDELEDNGGKKLYVVTIREKLYKNNTTRVETDTYDFRDVTFALIKIGAINKEKDGIYAIKPGELKTKRFATAGFINLYDFAYEKIKAYVEKNKQEIEDVITIKEEAKISKNLNYRIREIMDKADRSKYSSDSKFIAVAQSLKDNAQKYSNNRDRINKYEVILNAMNRLNITVTDRHKSIELEDFYPMFKFLSNWDWDVKNYDRIKAYIDMVDANK